ncbi:hypothetical protein MRX96_000707 [Rhipicephalus microplus]
MRDPAGPPPRMVDRGTQTDPVKKERTKGHHGTAGASGVTRLWRRRGCSKRAVVLPPVPRTPRPFFLASLLPLSSPPREPPVSTFRAFIIRPPRRYLGCDPRMRSRDALHGTVSLHVRDVYVRLMRISLASLLY